jgi:ComF family protein
MPLHRGRLWRRQFNQAALLADAMALASGLACDPFLLERVKATATQVGMSRAQRADNVQGAFRVPEGIASVRGRRVLLVDDVLTTGATANAAARVLLRAGAAAVDLAVFARVAGPAGIAI